MSTSKIYQFSITLIGFIVLSGGGIGLGQIFDNMRIAYLVVVLISIIFVLHTNRVPKENLFILTFTLCLFYLLTQMYRSSDYTVVLRRIDGFIICGSILYMLWNKSRALNEVFFYKSIIYAALIVLFCTILYKIQFGFWDRGVRFLLNGPITFGWNMTLALVVALQLFITQKRIVYILCVCIFFLAILWTFSKGPFLAAIIAMFLYAIRSNKKYGILTIVMIVVILNSQLAELILPDRLYSVLKPLLNGDVMSFLENRANFGSIGIRYLMFLDAIDIFSDNILFGIGVGNWDLYSSTSQLYGPMLYPHNWISELLSEHGIMGILIFGFILILIFKRLDFFGRVIFISMSTALLFSGDMEYWRYLLFVPLVFVQDTKLA